jgi:hypothetical protein
MSTRLQTHLISAQLGEKQLRHVNIIGLPIFRNRTVRADQSKKETLNSVFLGEGFHGFRLPAVTRQEILRI